MKTKVLEHIEVLVIRYSALEVIKDEIVAVYQIIEKSYKRAENLQGALPTIMLDGHPALSTFYMNDCEPLFCFA